MWMHPIGNNNEVFFILWYAKATRKQIRYEAEIPSERIKIAIFHELTHCFDAHGQSSQVVSFIRLASCKAHEELCEEKRLYAKKLGWKLKWEIKGIPVVVRI